MCELNKRLQRMYSATDATFDDNLNNFRAQIWKSPKGVLMQSDFNGGMSVSEMENSLQTLISLVASLEYHLRRWASKNGRDPNRVSWFYENSEPLKIVHDLWNNDKHGYPPSHGRDRTGRKPRLVHVRRSMRLKTRAEKGSWCTLQLAANGVPIASGDGSTGVVTTGDVLDGYDSTMGDAREILEKSVAALQQLCTDMDIPFPTSK